jgi:hypothetical protein
VEILVSTAILLMLLVLFGQILNSTTGAFSSGEANTERLQNARAINDFIGSEMQAALLPAVTSSSNSLQFVVNPTGVSATLGRNPDAIFWQAPIATDQRLGDVAEIGYFVNWDTTTKPSNPRARLCRFFVNPVKSGTSGAAAPEPNFLIYATPASWLTDSIIKDVVPVIDYPSSKSYQGLFAENVLGLWVSCLDSGSNPITVDASGAAYAGGAYDSRRGYLTDDPTDPNTPKGKITKRLPAIVDLSYVIIDSSAAAKVTPDMQAAIVSLYNTATDGDDFDRKAQSDSLNRFHAIKSSLRSYKTRIYLQNSQ